MQRKVSPESGHLWCLKGGTELSGNLGWERGERFRVPQGLELHVLVAQSFSATKKGKIINNNNNSKSDYNGGRTERTQGSKNGLFSCDKGVWGASAVFACQVRALSLFASGLGFKGQQFENQGEAEIRPQRKKFVIPQGQNFCFISFLM